MSPCQIKWIMQGNAPRYEPEIKDISEADKELSVLCEYYNMILQKEKGM